MHQIKGAHLNLKTKNTLFLQSPVGEFFTLLADFIERNHSCRTYQITFNAGDEWFSDSKKTTAFVGKPNQWYDFLKQFLLTHDITHVIVFGDCRFYHRIAKQVVQELGGEFWVFEEGYLRPTFVTFEKQGANGNSLFKQQSFTNLESLLPEDNLVDEIQLPFAFWYMTFSAMQYYFFKLIFENKYPHYLHHRPSTVGEECKKWLRSGIRKYWYKISERKLGKQLKVSQLKKYFLVPLQVSVDSQILFHSPYHTIEAFIKSTILSFATYANSDDLLVFKHHPMDRGFNHYGRYIQEVCELYNVNERVFYCHDLHLPTLIKGAKGIVTINSTVGISSLQHNIPTKVMGQAVYNFSGLTSQKSLDEFWQTCCPPCINSFIEFKQRLKMMNQISGSFYQQQNCIFEKVTNQLYKKTCQHERQKNSMSEAS